VMNLTRLRYYFELTTSPNVIWTDLAKFDRMPDSPVKILDPDNVGLSGDVTERFQSIEQAPF